MNEELVSAIKDLCKERGLDEEGVFTSIEEALVAAYRREFNAKSTDNITATVDRETGEMAVFIDKEIVTEVDDPNSQIALAEAKAIDEEFEEGDILQYQLQPEDFGRLAAQAAKTVINQNLITAEREMIQAEFSGKIGELAYGTVQRMDKREVIVDIGRAEAILTSREQSSLDSYEFNERMQFLIKRVDDRHGRPIIYVSRASADLVRKLFEKEVPEISTGVVEIASAAREAGSRTKISVLSHDENVDALGACVGQRGMRVQNVMDELRGEKIDIIEWDPDETVYIRNALKPANVLRVELTETEDSREATVVVPDSQLSLAIGKRGQNARLAAKLTGWKIDIKSESEARKALEEGFMASFDKAVGYTAGTDAGFAEDEAKQAVDAENSSVDAADSVDAYAEESPAENSLDLAADPADSADSVDSAQTDPESESEGEVSEMNAAAASVDSSAPDADSISKVDALADRILAYSNDQEDAAEEDTTDTTAGDVIAEDVTAEDGDDAAADTAE